MIRPARPEDMPRVWELVRLLAEYERLADHVTGSAERLAEGLGRDFGCHVCEEAGEIVGYALYFRSYSTFRAQPGIWLEDLFVTPACRGKGYGKALLTGLIDQARSEGLGRVEWSVLDWNQPAIDFYRSLGATLLEEWRICRVSP